MFSELLQKYLNPASDKLPDGLSIDENPTRLLIQKRAYGLHRLKGISGVIFFNFVFLIFMYGILFRNLNFHVEMEVNGSTSTALDYRALLVFIGIICISAWFNYRFLLRLFNTTTICVSPNSNTTVLSAPIPNFRNRTIPTTSIVQIYCTEQVTAQRNASGTTSARRSYSAHAVLNSGKRVLLTKLLDNFREASIIEERIETYLNLENQRVSGEFKP